MAPGAAARIQSPVISEDSASLAEEQARLEALDRLDILDTPREESFDRIARMVRRALDVPVAIVSFIDNHRQWYKACYGLDVQDADKQTTFCRMVLADRAPVIVTDAATDERVRDNPHVLARRGVRFYIGVPLTTRDGHILGTLCVIDYKPREPRPGDVEILKDFATIVMDELELRQAAALDPLTGAMSRKAFRSQVGRAIALAARARSNLAVFAIDLDYFKAVNDTYGHATGDAVLRSVVNAAKAELRKSDDIGRLGGEEFAVLLPGAHLRHAVEVAERIRARIERTPVDTDGIAVHTTASIGVATNAGPSDTVDELLKNADDALYLAKNSGRNRVLAWQPPADAPRLHLRRVLKAGTLIFNRGKSSFDCTIRGLSEDGAGVDVYSSVGIPDDVELRMAGETSRKGCRVVTRGDRHLELAFT
jgi:diguanylate cyclase (GGDEF)-like protein